MPNVSSKEGLRSLGPNPYETVPPSTAGEAFEDLFRYLAGETSRDVVRELVTGMDPAGIVLAVQGKVSGRPLSGFEAEVGNAVEYCVREGLLQTPTGAVFALVSVRQEMLDGGVFVGEERVKS